jgi:hypothetical protein
MPINPDTFNEKRSHPSEGMEREDIIITDIKVTPLSYVHKGDYLWRVGGLVVWKSDAALVQVFTIGKEKDSGWKA